MTVSRSPGRPRHDDRLTPAEWRVADAVRHGLTNPQVAERLDIGVDAVKYHLGNIFSKLALSDRNALRQWGGTRKETGMNVEMDTPPKDFPLLGQVARSVGDPDGSRAFYADTLGLALLYSHGDLHFFDLEGVRLMLTPGDPQANSILYFRTDHLEARHAALVEAGVEIAAAPHRVHVHDDGREEHMCFFKDPDGCILAYMSVTPPKT